MPRYTAEKVFGIFPTDAPALGLAVDVGAGDVTIKVLVDQENDTYIDHKVYVADTADSITVAGLQIKITPTGGAAYWLGHTTLEK